MGRAHRPLHRVKHGGSGPCPFPTQKERLRLSESQEPQEIPSLGEFVKFETLVAEVELLLVHYLTQRAVIHRFGVASEHDTHEVKELREVIDRLVRISENRFDSFGLPHLPVQIAALAYAAAVDMWSDEGRLHRVASQLALKLTQQRT